MGKLLNVIRESLSSLGNLTIVLVIMIYIFAALGMALFSDSYTEEKFDGPVPRWNFNVRSHVACVCAPVCLCVCVQFLF